MIFVSVGTHPQPFDRLLKALDELVEKKKIKESVFAQIGYANYIPTQFPSKPFLPIPEFNQKIQQCTLFISHGGEGNIGTALQFHKPMVLVPRLKKFREHTNDHQLELVEAIASQQKAVACLDMTQLMDCIEKAKKMDLIKQERGKVLEYVEEFLHAEENRLA